VGLAAVDPLPGVGLAAVDPLPGVGLAAVDPLPGVGLAAVDPFAKFKAKKECSIIHSRNIDGGLKF